MTFASGYWVFLIIVLPAAAVLVSYLEKRRVRAIREFFGTELHQQMSGSDPLMRWVRHSLRWAALGMLIIGLMQPQWGFEWKEFKRKGVDIMIAFDVSKSMMAEDVKPNRFEAAKREVKSFINQLKGDRIGITAFAGGAFIQCPLTLDYGTAKLFIDHLDIGSVGRGGTSLTAAIRKSIEAFEGHEKKNRILIVITDGEDHSSGLDDALDEAKHAGLTIHTVGIGKTEGAPIPDAESQNRKAFIKDRKGSVVLSKLDSTSLMKIAKETGGYSDVIGSGRFPLEIIYKDFISGLRGDDLGVSRTKEYDNHFRIFIGLALLLFLIECSLSERRSKKR